MDDPLKAMSDENPLEVKNGRYTCELNVECKVRETSLVKMAEESCCKSKYFSHGHRLLSSNGDGTCV